MNKQSGILKHYIEKFNNQTFDEYDVMGFLINIRNDELKHNQPTIYDFANIVAHRTRTEGIAFIAMNSAILNEFQQNPKGMIKGYNGVSYNLLVKEIKQLFTTLGITPEKSAIKDFILCLMSIAQGVVCMNKNQQVCELQLFQGKNNALALSTMGTTATICYLRYTPKFEFKNSYSCGYIREAVEMIRVNGKLEMHFCENGNKV